MHLNLHKLFVMLLLLDGQDPISMYLGFHSELTGLSRFRLNQPHFGGVELYVVKGLRLLLSDFPLPDRSQRNQHFV